MSGDDQRRDELANLHRRMDTQDTLLREIRDKVVGHIAEESTYKTALEELVVLWRGSKIIIPTFAAITACLWAVIVWFRDHVK